MRNTSYHFTYRSECEMCGDEANDHKVLGQRLNISQGLNPRSKKGVATTVVKCNNCGLVYCNPQPVPLSLQDHYNIVPESYWKPDYFKHDPQYFSHELKRVSELMAFEKGMKALDVGAGLGKCMISLQNYGFEAHGLEPSRSFHKKAIEQMEIEPGKLKLAMIEEAEFPNDYFDFITFGAVLEHLYHPTVCIDKAIQWLKPGGLIHIEIPSADYLVSRFINLFYKVMGTSFVTNTSPMHQPYHLYEFTVDSFEKFGKRTKSFEIAFHEYFVCSAEPFPKFLQPLFRSIMKSTKTGMQLSIWLRKN